MLQRDLNPDQAVKLANILLSQDNSQNYVMVSIGGKIGSGKLIGANEGERLMRPFDASLTNDKSKDVVPAKRLEFVGGYAGLWKVTFDQNSIKGPLFNGQWKELIFEARLNQNLDIKAKFPIDSVAAPGQGAGNSSVRLDSLASCRVRMRLRAPGVTLAPVRCGPVPRRV